MILSRSNGNVVQAKKVSEIAQTLLLEWSRIGSLSIWKARASRSGLLPHRGAYSPQEQPLLSSNCAGAEILPPLFLEPLPKCSGSIRVMTAHVSLSQVSLLVFHACLNPSFSSFYLLLGLPATSAQLAELLTSVSFALHKPKS